MFKTYSGDQDWWSFRSPGSVYYNDGHQNNSIIVNKFANYTIWYQ